jgi:dTDP-4-dehydrorhamnose 3,5-epimerase
MESMSGRPSRATPAGSEVRMPFRLEQTDIEAVKVVVPEVLLDDRGFFTEVYRQDTFLSLGLPGEFVQVNQSKSVRNVVRGLHFQWDPPMGKLMRVTVGEAFLVAVDIRPGSPTLGQWVGVTFSADGKRQLWAPAGFARGFCALSEVAEIEYLCTGVYNHSGESGVRWDDSEIGIRWPVREPILSSKDRHAQSLSEWLARPEAARFRYDASSSR